MFDSDEHVHILYTQQGDTAAFTPLFIKYQPRIYYQLSTSSEHSRHQNLCGKDQRERQRHFTARGSWLICGE